MFLCFHRADALKSIDLFSVIHLLFYAAHVLGLYLFEFSCVGIEQFSLGQQLLLVLRVQGLRMFQIIPQIISVRFLIFMLQHLRLEVRLLTSVFLGKLL